MANWSSFLALIFQFDITKLYGITEHFAILFIWKSYVYSKDFWVKKNFNKIGLNDFLLLYQEIFVEFYLILLLCPSLLINVASNCK